MDQQTLFKIERNQLVDLKSASIWASQYLNKKVTVSNISYLIQYGRINKYGNEHNLLLDINELKNYYDKNDKEKQWKEKLGDDLSWHLSFSEYKESERTKHVHRLHPYKGKFIPQLVEYFLDSHTDEFKKEVYFHEGDIVLDPFCGSGTTLIQANELGIHAIGIDISAFNALISNVKVKKHNISQLKKEIQNLTTNLDEFEKSRNNIIFEDHLLRELSIFNNKYFPSPEYKRKVKNGEINEEKYGREKENEFLKIYTSLIDKYQIALEQESHDTFLDKWYLKPVREEIDFLFELIREIEDKDIKAVLAIILSRTIRSCRATTHSDLGTLKEPMTTTYYCRKHAKICKPIFSIRRWWGRYTADTIQRLQQFDQLRTDTYQTCLPADSRSANIYDEVRKRDAALAQILASQKIKGIFTSPPYVGLIDYHEQHAYAYELFGFNRKDELEIGPLYKGNGLEARNSYIRGIADVLLNCKKYLQEDYDIFLVANDKYNLYPKIADLASMRIVDRFKRPVLNRVEKDRNGAYSETIFHLKEI